MGDSAGPAETVGGTDLRELSLAWQSFGCAVCGQVARPEADPGWRIELHHVKSRAQWDYERDGPGRDHPTNLMGLCGELLPNKCHWRVTTGRMRLTYNEKVGGYVWLDTRSGETGLCRPLVLEMAAETGLDRHLTAPVALLRDRTTERRPLPPERAETFAAEVGVDVGELTGGGVRGAERRFMLGRSLNDTAERAWMALAVVVKKADEMGDAQMLGFEDWWEWGEAMGVNKSTLSKLRTIGAQFAGKWEMLPAADKAELSLEGLYVAARMVKTGHWDEDRALTEAVAQPVHKLWRTYRETVETGAAPHTVETHACPECGQLHAKART